MAYTVTTTFYGEPSIADEYGTYNEAIEAMQDAKWAAVHAPSDVAGDIRSVTLRNPDGVVLSRATFG